MAEQLKFVLSLEEAGSNGVASREAFSKVEEEAKTLARAPISGIQDVVLGVGASGRVFIGVNVEFEGLPIHQSISAEQFLVNNLALSFERELIWCLLPARYDLKTFKQEVSRLLEPQNNLLALSDSVSAAGICSKTEEYSTCFHPKCWALEAANRSYPLYSECPSGVALISDGGEVYSGWYIESEDYNFSVGPLQAALVDFVARGKGKRFEDIVGAVLVEMKDANVSQEATARILLKTIAPDCDFSVLNCYKTGER